MLYGLLGTGPWQLQLCGFIFMTPKHLDGGKRWVNLPDALSTWHKYQDVSRTRSEQQTGARKTGKRSEHKKTCRFFPTPKARDQAEARGYIFSAPAS